jgi:hypothetical protein
MRDARNFHAALPMIDGNRRSAMVSSNESWAASREVYPGDVKDGMHRIVVGGGGAGGLELATQLGVRLGRQGRAHVTLIGWAGKQPHQPAGGEAHVAMRAG